MKKMKTRKQKVSSYMWQQLASPNRAPVIDKLRISISNDDFSLILFARICKKKCQIVINTGSGSKIVHPDMLTGL